MSEQYLIPSFVSEIIQKSIGSTGKLSGPILSKNKTPEFNMWCEENNLTPPAIFYILSHNIKSFPVCKICGERLTSAQIVSGNECCSCTCKKKDPDIVKKMKSTMIKRYGAENPMLVDSMKQKQQQTLLSEYGITNPSLSKELIEKKKQIYEKKYGCSWGTFSDHIEKQQQTCLMKYGTRFPHQLKEIQEKCSETWRIKYGVDFPSQSETIKEKIKQTNLERYGTEWFQQSNEFADKLNRGHRNNYWEIFVEKLKAKRISVVSTKDQFIKNAAILRCDICGNSWETSLTNPQNIFCENCCRQHSQPEKDLVDFIKANYSGIMIENDRSVLNGRELDIYLPEKKIAFEFDGNYWHSDQFKNRKYHQEKTLECREKGIQLVHIFEFEWVNKRDKIKALIVNLISNCSRRIFARNCECKEILAKQYEEFLDQFHLNGSIHSALKLGLFLNDELIAVAGFGKSRFKKDEIELHRYCVKQGIHVVGGFSKLVKYSKLNAFISYVDLSHFSGLGYEKIGFKLLSITPPNYVYEKANKILSRMQCQKKKLPVILKENFSEELSEYDNMIQNGWHRIFDCGNLKYSYSKD